MSRKLSGLQKRLAKVEQQTADRARRAELANCTCREWTFITAFGAAEGLEAEKGLEAEMNRTCPVHGFRRLGQIFVTHFVAPEDDKAGVERCRRASAEVDRQLEIYEARLAEQDSQKLEDDAEEL